MKTINETRETFKVGRILVINGVEYKVQRTSLFNKGNDLRINVRTTSTGRPESFKYINSTELQKFDWTEVMCPVLEEMIPGKEYLAEIVKYK